METADNLRKKAASYRAMVYLVSDQRLIDALLSLAMEYEALADRFERDGTTAEE